MDATNHGRPAGREGLRRIFRSLVTAFPDLRFELGQVVADGEHVRCEEIISGTHLGDSGVARPRRLAGGRAADGAADHGSEHPLLPSGGGGEIAEHRAVRDDLGIMQQLGLLPSTIGDVSRPDLGR